MNSVHVYHLSVHMHHLYKLCLCHSEVRTLPKLPSRGLKVFGDWSSVFPEGKKLRGQPSKKDHFSMKETHLERSEMPRHERGCPRHPWGSRKICSKKMCCELTLFTGWANSANISKYQGHVTILNAKGMDFLFNCKTMSLMLEPARSGL